MKKGIYIRIGIVVGMALVGAYFYGKLPDTIPIHWNFEGEADNWGNKLSVLAGIPALTLLLVLLFPFLSKIDPKSKNYEKFSSVWEIFQYLITIFMAYSYFISIYVILNPEINIGTYIMVGMGILFIILGNYMGKIKQNFFVGMKFPWTLQNEEVWNKTHRFSGKMFMLGGLLFIINAFLNWQPMWIFVLVIILVLVVPIIYSYLAYQKVKK